MRTTPRAIFRRDRAHRGSSAATVTIHVRNLAQLFNSLDPAPFWDRDLDRTAAEFIEGEFSDKRSADIWHLHVYATEGAQLAADLQAAVEHYYERLATSASLQLRDSHRIGGLTLLAGITIFLLCTTAQQLLRGLLKDVPAILDQGLIILAWLALWRPAEAIVYDWIPIYRKRRLYQRLAGIRVTVRQDTAAPPVPGPAARAAGAGTTPHHA